MIPSIELLVIGNEMLSGRTVDRNSPYLTRMLAEAGFSVSHVTIAGDDRDDLARVFRVSAERSDIVIATGGLGPTSDDLTREAVSDAFGLALELDEAALRKIKALFRRRKRFMSSSNRSQAMVPSGARTIDNPLGTAPGIQLEAGRARVFLLPGVPSEMEAIFTGSVLPEIKEEYAPEPVETAKVRVTGISESELFDSIRHLPGAERAFSFYPNPEGILLLVRTGPDAPMGAVELGREAARILGEKVYSTGDETLEQVIGNLLRNRGKTLAVAESCTGGLVAHRLTNVPGSSDYLLLGVVAYADDAKVKVLGVDPALIAGHGAVSAEVASAMAEGVRALAGADIGISTTGIAGPGGGSEKKPVGLMFAGYAAAGFTETKRLHFVDERIINKHRMSQTVLDILRIHMEND
jgi:nicotinamide-nucleotide amidase